MKSKKEIITYSLLFGLCLVFINLSIAQDFHFSQYHSSPLQLNPALTGLINGTYRMNINYRDQWNKLDGNNFKTVKTVASMGAGSHNYEVEVNQPQKRMFYRVVAVDLDNRKSYGVVLVLQLSNCTKAAIVHVFPIPANRDQKVTMQANSNDKITYRLIDISGKVVQTGVFVRTKQIGGVNSGIYLLEMTSAYFKETQTIVIH